MSKGRLGEDNDKEISQEERIKSLTFCQEV